MGDLFQSVFNTIIEEEKEVKRKIAFRQKQKLQIRCLNSEITALKAKKVRQAELLERKSAQCFELKVKLFEAEKRCEALKEIQKTEENALEQARKDQDAVLEEREKYIAELEAAGESLLKAKEELTKAITYGKMGELSMKKVHLVKEVQVVEQEIQAMETAKLQLMEKCAQVTAQQNEMKRLEEQNLELMAVLKRVTTESEELFAKKGALELEPTTNPQYQSLRRFLHNYENTQQEQLKEQESSHKLLVTFGIQREVQNHGLHLDCDLFNASFALEEGSSQVDHF